MATISRATVTLNIVGCGSDPSPTLAARNDYVTVTSPGLAIPDVKANDTYSGAVTLHVEGTIPPELHFSATTGEVFLQNGAAHGTYFFSYWLCAAGEAPGSLHCSKAVVTVRYAAPGKCYRVARGVYNPCT